MQADRRDQEKVLCLAILSCKCISVIQDRKLRKHELLIFCKEFEKEKFNYTSVLVMISLSLTAIQCHSNITHHCQIKLLQNIRGCIIELLKQFNFLDKSTRSLFEMLSSAGYFDKFRRQCLSQLYLLTIYISSGNNYSTVKHPSVFPIL